MFHTSRVPQNCWPQTRHSLKERNEEERKLTDPWVVTVCSASGFLSPSLHGYSRSQIGHFLITVILFVWAGGALGHAAVL